MNTKPIDERMQYHRGQTSDPSTHWVHAELFSDLEAIRETLRSLDVNPTVEASLKAHEAAEMSALRFGPADPEHSRLLREATLEAAAERKECEKEAPPNSEIEAGDMIRGVYWPQGCTRRVVMRDGHHVFCDDGECYSMAGLFLFSRRPDDPRDGFEHREHKEWGICFKASATISIGHAAGHEVTFSAYRFSDGKIRLCQRCELVRIYAAGGEK